MTGDIVIKTDINIKLVENIPLVTDSSITEHSFLHNGLLIYELNRKKLKSTYLILKNAPQEDLLSYLAVSSPEVYESIYDYLDKSSLYLDLIEYKAWNNNGPDSSLEAKTLLEALSTIASFPQKSIDIHNSNGNVSVILAGGKGSRMRSKDTHKVCFPIAGRPSINRLLEQLESAGIHEHVIVTGEKGKQLVNEVTDVRDGVTFVYQINQNGTGSAAKQAAYLLRAQDFKGSILVVPGDKVIEESALRRLFKNFSDSNADVALMTADKKIWPDAGRIVFDKKGRPIDIVEKRDIQKLILARRLLELKRTNREIATKTLVNEIEADIISLSKARTMFPALIDYCEKNKYISSKKLEEMLPEDDTYYRIGQDNEQIKYTGIELEQATPTTNAAVYLFKSDAFFQSVFEVKSENAQKEEYFTDVIRLLSRSSTKTYKLIPVPVRDQYEVMSYNNPEELLKTEEYYIRKESATETIGRSGERIEAGTRIRALRPVEEWIRVIEEFGPEIKESFRNIYGDEEQLISERRKVYLRTLQKFVKVYGTRNSVMIARSPGRVNLMGRHVEHRGGFTNYMTINREALLVAGLREDDVIEIHNVESRQFRPRSFSIGNELSRLPWDEWLNMIDSQTVLEMIRSSRGDWANYFKAAALRLQEQFKGRLLYGFNGVFSSNIPLAAGLSSSSAVVVSAAEILTAMNGLSFVPKDFVDLCGESEWFVGTRGGSGDHAAMKFGQKGKIIHMGFHEIRVEDIFPFPENYRLIILQSHQYAKKSDGAMQTFNEKVATYEVAQAIFKARFPELSNRITYFRDINTERFCLKPYEIYDILLKIPERISRKELMKIINDDDKATMEKVFSSHQEPEGGYEARSVSLYGLSEIARAIELAGMIKNNKIDEAGTLMTISHNGDRVSRLDANGNRIPYNNSTSDDHMLSLRKRLSKGDNTASLYLQPGGYGCSTTIIDEMVDISLGINGVVGAQLSGAGLGGCIMVLVRNEAVDEFQKIMKTSFYEKHELPEKVVTCSPIAGSGILTM